ncbi:MAG: hypothetical protein AABZ27_02195 [Candidatus Omnitrophota bacterium]
MPKNKKNIEGVTIIELIMTIVIVGALVGGSAMYIKEIIGLWRFLSFRSEAVSQARTALVRISREIRQANSINTAQSSRINFDAADLGADDADLSDDTVEFYLNNSNELRRVFNNDNSGQGYILASGVSSPIFIYYDADKTVTAQLNQIKMISITMTVSAGNQSKTLRTLVCPRNL